MEECVSSLMERRSWRSTHLLFVLHIWVLVLYHYCKLQVLMCLHFIHILSRFCFIEMVLFGMPVGLGLGRDHEPHYGRGDPTLPYYQPPHFDPPPIPSYSSRRVHSETPIYVPPHSYLWVMGHHSNISSSICTHLHADAHLWMHMHTHACRCMHVHVHYPTLD